MDLVFRSYDQPQLDHQMSPRGTVPDVAPFLKEYASESAKARKTLPCHLDLPYGPSEPERLDVFPVANGASVPVFVFIHGGYWRLLDAADSSFMAKSFTQAGACVVAVNYALAPGASLGEIVRQCRAALAWVFHNIAKFGGDPNRIHVSGSSAGGHLAAAMLMPGWHAALNVPETIVSSASPLSGLFDLEPVRLSHINSWMNLSQADVAELSPIRHLPVRPVPLVVSYAPSETYEFQRQSEIYAAACMARGCPVEIVVEPGTNHFDLPMMFMDPGKHLSKSVLKLMGL